MISVSTRLDLRTQEAVKELNADERRLKTLKIIRVHGSSSATLTDLFTSSSLLAILFIISDKYRRMHAERGITPSKPPSVF